MDILFALIFGSICASVFLLYKNGYFDLFFEICKFIKVINKTIVEMNINSETIKQYMSIFNGTNMTISNDVKNKTYISKSGKCIHIYYDYLGEEYILTVPYSGLSSVDMIQYEMNAIYENGNLLKITQQPGIPYLVSANNLGSMAMKAINHENDIFHEYKNYEVPQFCLEICD